MARYVLSGAPNLYADHIKNRIGHVFSAHLHFPGDLDLDQTRFHLCKTSITMDDPNCRQSTTATATMVEYRHKAFRFGQIVAQ